MKRVTGNILKYSKLLKATTINRKVFPVEKMVKSSVNCKRLLKFNQNRRIKGHKINFTHVFRPIYYFARFCGQMPFSIVQSSNDEFRQPRVSKRDILWFIISICIYSALVMFNCWYILRAYSFFKYNKILYLLAWSISLLRFINFLCAILILIMDMCNRHKLVDILNKFTAFDRKVRFWCGREINIDSELI